MRSVSEGRTALEKKRGTKRKPAMLGYQTKIVTYPFGGSHWTKPPRALNPQAAAQGSGTESLDTSRGWRASGTVKTPRQMGVCVCVCACVFRVFKGKLFEGLFKGKTYQLSLVWGYWSTEPSQANQLLFGGAS